MKTRVRVEVTSVNEVDIVVEHEEGDDPTDLTEKELSEVYGLVRLTNGRMAVTDVREMDSE